MGVLCYKADQAGDIAVDALEKKVNPNVAAARSTGMIPQRQRPPPGYYRDLVPQDSYAAPSYLPPQSRGNQPDPDPYLTGFGPVLGGFGPSNMPKTYGVGYNDQRKFVNTANIDAITDDDATEMGAAAAGGAVAGAPGGPVGSAAGATSGAAGVGFIAP